MLRIARVRDAIALKEMSEKAQGAAADILWRIYHAKIAVLEKELVKLPAKDIAALFNALDRSGTNKIVKLVK